MTEIIAAIICLVLLFYVIYATFVFDDWKHPSKRAKYRIIELKWKHKTLYVPQFSRRYFFFRVWGDWEHPYLYHQRAEFLDPKEAQEFIDEYRYKKKPKPEKPIKTIWTDEK